MYKSICLYMYKSICLSIYRSVYLSIYLYRDKNIDLHTYV